MKGRLLITGAGGFTGQHACRHFTRAGFEVIGVVRHTAPSEQIERCDLTNKHAVKKLIQAVQPDYLLHLAGQNHVGRSWQEPLASLEANAMSTAYLLEALRHEKPACKALIVGSALQFDPANLASLTHPYSLSKTMQALISQSWVTLYHMDIILAKPSNLIGPGPSNGVCAIFTKKLAEMERCAAEPILELNSLQVWRDFLDVRDAVHAYEILLQHGTTGETYDICSGRQRSLNDIVTLLKQLASIDFQVQEQSNVYDKPNIVSPKKLFDLGWKQTIPLEKSLQDTLDFYRKKGCS